MRSLYQARGVGLEPGVVCHAVNVEQTLQLNLCGLHPSLSRALLFGNVCPLASWWTWSCSDCWASGCCTWTYFVMSGRIGDSESGSVPGWNCSVAWPAGDGQLATDAPCPWARLPRRWMHMAMGQAAGIQEYSNHGIKDVCWSCSGVSHSWLRDSEVGETSHLSLTKRDGEVVTPKHS